MVLIFALISFFALILSLIVFFCVHWLYNLKNQQQYSQKYFPNSRLSHFQIRLVHRPLLCLFHTADTHKTRQSCLVSQVLSCPYQRCKIGITLFLRQDRWTHSIVYWYSLSVCLSFLFRLELNHLDKKLVCHILWTLQREIKRSQRSQSDGKS